MSEARRAPVQVPSEPSTAELVRGATEQISRLVRDEFRLARKELMEKGRRAGSGAGLLGGGGLLAALGAIALLAAIVFALAEVMPGWLAAALVGVVLLIVAAGMALVGRARVRRGMPPVPETAVDNMREDVGTVASAVRNRGRR
ncbi:MAG: phage holin family protein [Micromonosporaceae bacterium]